VTQYLFIILKNNKKMILSFITFLNLEEICCKSDISLYFEKVFYSSK